MQEASRRLHQMGGTSHLTEKEKKNDPDRKDILG